MVEKNHWFLKGKIVSGIKEGAFFTRLDWVQEQCMEKLGFRPYPGTLNVEVSSEYVSVIEAIQKAEGVVLASPDPAFCSGRALPAEVEGISGAVVIPAAEVRVHGKNIVEIIAPQRLKDALNVTDGDVVTVVVSLSQWHKA